MGRLKQAESSDPPWDDDVARCVRSFANRVFTLREFYAMHEQDLAIRHPRNHHVQDKICQQLQVLRDRGVIRFLGRGRYVAESGLGSLERMASMPRTNRVFDAIAFQQGVGREHGQEMFLFAAPASWLSRHTKIDQWKPESESEELAKQGYQRVLTDSHVADISRYLRGALQRSSPTESLPVLPTSILLSCREPLNFTPLPNDGASAPVWARPGKLEIGPDTQLWIVDGQHRLAGIKHAIEQATPDVQALLGDYHLPVTVMVCQNKIDEMLHFVTINGEAKSVRTDLAQRLLDTIRQSDPGLIGDEKARRAVTGRSEAISLVKYLETRPDQRWFGRIAKPNERRTGEKVASEGQLSKSLRHICKAKPIAWGRDELQTFVVDFWSAIAELIPQAFAQPAEYVIQKGPGFGSLHHLLPKLTLEYTDRAGLKALLENVEPYFTDAEYWLKGGEASQYSSEGGYKVLAELIEEAIKGASQRFH